MVPNSLISAYNHRYEMVVTSCYLNNRPSYIDNKGLSCWNGPRDTVSLDGAGLFIEGISIVDGKQSGPISELFNLRNCPCWLPTKMVYLCVIVWIWLMVGWFFFVWCQILSGENGIKHVHHWHHDNLIHMKRLAFYMYHVISKQVNSCGPYMSETAQV